MTDFVKGARVRLSEYGRESSGWGESLWNRVGTVVGLSRKAQRKWILWDGRVSRESVFEGFLELAP